MTIKIEGADILIHKSLNSSNVAVILPADTFETAHEVKAQILEWQRMIYVLTTVLEHSRSHHFTVQACRNVIGVKS